MHTFQCVGCGLEASGAYSNKRFCSKACARKVRERENREQVNQRMREYRQKNGDHMRAWARDRLAKKAALRPHKPVVQCPQCGSSFSQRDPRQLHCSKACGVKSYYATPDRRAQAKEQYKKHHTKRRQHANDRYRNDAEYRNKILMALAEDRASNPERHKAIAARYRHKPENMEKARVKSQAWHRDNRESANVRRIGRKQKERVAYPWKGCIDAARVRASAKGLAFDLSVEWAASVWTGRCAVSGLPFSEAHRGPGPRFFSPSIDRIVPELGYEKGNCRFVLWCVNAFKHSGTDEEMYMVAEAICANRSLQKRDMSQPHFPVSATDI